MLRKLGTGVAALCMAAAFSMVACSDDDSGSECGDGVVEGSEVCDSTALGGATCADEGFTGGDLSCNASCNGFDTSACTDDVCGDGAVTGSEDCDGADLDNTTCEDLDYDGGDLSCDSCSFDETGCYMNCGDDVIQAGDEVCDGSDLDGADCLSEGFDAGSLACNTNCQAYDTAACCDDGCPAADDTLCTADTLSTCALGANGCLDWVDTDCTATGDICSGTPADCNPPCTSDCPALGDTECIDATTLNSCADGGDGCNYWTASLCTGGFCGDTPAQCFNTGSGLDCNDVYNLDGRAFPHTMAGEWDTGAYTFQGTCQDGANPVYLSYTLQGAAVDHLVFEITDTSAYPEISAWTTTEATGFCDGAQMTELGCATGGTGSRTLTVDATTIAQGTVIYFLAGGDGPTWPLGDQEITVSEQTCGNGIIEVSETCDDGNTTSGDGCSVDCQIEATYWCGGEPSVCMVPACGDGYFNDAAELCDDGNTADGDGCSSTCVIETGYTCAGEPSVCALSCGDGVINGGDECDDGNTADADGCNSACVIESGYICAGEPSVCAQATVYSQTGLAMAIPDDAYDGTAMACVSFTVPSTGADTVANVEVEIAMDHTWIGDLVIKVFSPANTVTTLLSRPGFAETVDDGTGGFGTGSDLVATSPITFSDGSVNDAEAMGATANVVCLDDGICDFTPSPGMGPGTNGFADFAAESAVGVWQVCFGDSAGADTGTVDSVTLSLVTN